MLQLRADSEQSGEFRLVRINVTIESNRFQDGVVFDILEVKLNSSADFTFGKIAVEEDASRNDGVVVTVTIRAIQSASEMTDTCGSVNQTYRTGTAGTLVILFDETAFVIQCHQHRTKWRLPAIILVVT